MVDDENAIAKVYHAILIQLGYQVTILTDSQDALASGIKQYAKKPVGRKELGGDGSDSS